jgi:hypothetical protein
MVRWRVDIIRKRAEHLGTVEAAIEKAAKQFDIPPDRQNRITVQKMGKDNGLARQHARVPTGRRASRGH